MVEQVKDVDKPFHVVVLYQDRDAVFASGHDNLALAEANAAKCNAQAQELGLEAKYEAREGAWA